MTNEELKSNIKELFEKNWEVITEKGVTAIKMDGKPLNQIIGEQAKIIQGQAEKITKLEQENAELKKEKLDQEKVVGILKEIFGEDNFKKDEKGKEKYIGAAGGNPTKPIEPVVPDKKPDELSTPSDAQNEEKAWENFFAGKNITDKEAWKLKSGLTAAEAQKVWDNKWQDLTTNIADLGSKQMTYSSNGQTTPKVELLKHLKDELDKVHQLITNLNGETDLAHLIKEGDISAAYLENQVPGTLNYQKVKEIRESKVKELFRKNFEVPTSTGLNPEQIELWRSSNTGLSKNGTEERKVFDNGWTKPDEIKNAKLTSYTTPETTETETNIEVLKVVRPELDKANSLVKEIKATTTFKQIDDWKVTNKSRVESLIDSKLPKSKQQESVWNIFQAHRNTFKYHLNVKDNEVENDGLTEQELTDAREKLKEENQWKSKEFNPLTADILNQLFSLTEDAPYKDLEKWLRDEGGYTIDTEPKQVFKVAEIVDDQFTGNRIEKNLIGQEVIEQEEEWTKQGLRNLQGAYLLPFFYAKNSNFDPDNLKNSDGTWNEDMFAKIGPDGEINKTKGTLAIGTGVGKTTKTVNCIINGGENNVILVCPEESLVNDAYNHHRGWLQQSGGIRYKCVVHGVDHGVYETELKNLIYYDDRTDPDKKKWKIGQGKKGLSILEAKDLLGYMARSAVQLQSKDKVPKPLIAEPTAGEKAKIVKEGEKMPTLKLNENLEQNIAKIKERCINKEDTIIIFDEAHYNDAKYQEIQKQVVKNGYKVLLMSATFPGVDFSITTSHPRDVYFVKKFQPDLVDDGKGGKIEKWSKQKTAIFLPSTEDEWEINETTGKKKGQTKWGGLTKAQRDLLDKNNISYVILDKTNSAAATGITEGMGEGTVFFFSPAYEMGFSPDCHNVIVSGFTQLLTLGKGKAAPWIYGKPQELPVPIASLVQQIGRVSRLYRGWAYILSTTVKEIIAEEDLAYKFVAAIMSGDLAELNKYGLNMGKTDANFLRASVALPYKFGFEPEEIMVGLRGRPVGDAKTIPSYPTYGNKPVVVDEELWNKHLGNPTPPQIDKERSKQILLVMVMTFLKNEPDITKEIKVSFSSTLIGDVWGKEVKEGGEKGKTKKVFGEEEKKEVIKEVRKVLHTVADKYRKKLKDYAEGKNEYSGTEKDTYSALVRLYRAVNEAVIEVKAETDKEKSKPTLTINYSASKIGKRILEEWGEIGTWDCRRCLKVNNGYKFCEECGIDVRLNDRKTLFRENDYQAQIQVDPKK
ncbi:MAG: DEAD/DEAH box helicase family protein [Candidatus Moeniiplasma glomeromycotorum]|nr:DEAD/DEAH box helicase family protein [Candidatus Moeniiplasma glomeromycotorum]MCE8167339.1 DEAD/DEAH box helicase family protein [Candidatus Moeniiplasma glomeromycotorum]MCE8168648.1 DEAD/DEAH box helicase family protein [Candidatus Moeniiplasma glomeromycotorum]